MKGENITNAYYEDAFSAFLNSSGHKANMESADFTQIACATAYVYVWVPRDDNDWGGYFNKTGSGTAMCLW